MDAFAALQYIAAMDASAVTRPLSSSIQANLGGARCRALLLFTAAMLASAAVGCGPSINAAAKADIDRRVSALAAPSASFPAPVGFVPLPLAPGQWTQYKMTDDKGQPSFLTHKILAEEAGAHWIEAVVESYSGRTVQKMLVAFGNRMDPNQVEIRAVTTKDMNGTVNEMPAGMMPMLQSLYKSVVSAMIINWQGLPQEPTAVPAGNFDGCFRARSDVQWGPWRSVADSWSHAAVPISGAVRSKGVDKPFTMELVAFGLSGAKSEL